MAAHPKTAFDPLDEVRTRFTNMIRTDIRFHGEKRWVPYFYHLVEESEKEGNTKYYDHMIDAHGWAFFPTPDDIKLFPELTEVKEIHLMWEEDLDMFTVETYTTRVL